MNSRVLLIVLMILSAAPITGRLLGQTTGSNILYGDVTVDESKVAVKANTYDIILINLYGQIIGPLRSGSGDGKRRDFAHARRDHVTPRKCH
jgi:hypothetical protein